MKSPNLASIVALTMALAFGADHSLAAPFTAKDLNMLARVADPQVSPDGRYVAYTLRETDLEANRGRTDVWLAELSGTGLAKARRLTQHPASDSSAR